MHCHLGSMPNADQVAKRAEQLGLVLLNVTVSPTDANGSARLNHHANVRAACGLHPWWIANGACGEEDVARAALMCAASRFVGEIGLDFSGERMATAPQQQEAFDWIIQSCAEHPVTGRVISIHAIRAASEALDTLQRFDMPHNSTCIFHWFRAPATSLPEPALWAATFPSMRACSPPSAGANTHGRFHWTSCCLKPMRQRSLETRATRRPLPVS